ncbi:MAG: hypothetical protein FD180_3689 [Planctomycetota bacterium]|nr:MAG: hypothetical protein FD180_3689 [Planctomycetota bacterium]
MRFCRSQAFDDGVGFGHHGLDLATQPRVRDAETAGGDVEKEAGDGKREEEAPEFLGDACGGGGVAEEVRQFLEQDGAAAAEFGEAFEKGVVRGGRAVFGGIRDEDRNARLRRPLPSFFFGDRHEPRARERRGDVGLVPARAGLADG